jgi:hypothetical protein
MVLYTMLPDDLVRFGEKECLCFRVNKEGIANIFLLNTGTSSPCCMVAHYRRQCILNGTIILKNICSVLVSVNTKKIFGDFLQCLDLYRKTDL